MTGPIMCEVLDNQSALISKAARDWEDWHTPERLTEVWKRQDSEATFVRDVQDFMLLCIALSSSCDGLWQSAQKNLFENRSLDYQDYGKRVGSAFDAAIRAFALVRSCVNTACSRGYSVDGLADFDDAEGRIRLAKQRFLSLWPWVDDEVVKLSGGQYAGGQYQNLDEFINKIQSNHSEVGQG